MRASILYTIIFILTLSNPVLGQEKRVWNNQSEIYERLDYHRQNLNEDSAIYYVDELLQFQYEQQEDKSLGKVGPNITKIDVLILFKRYDEALELALSSMESCEKSLSPRNCSPCSRTFERLSDLMIILQDYRQGIAYLDKTCEEQKKGNYYYKKAKCFGLLEKPDSAFAITKKWITIVKESGKEKDLIPAYNQHGIIARDLKKFDIAIIAFSKAIEIIKTNELKMSRYAFIMGNLGACYQKLGEFDKAYACLLIDSEGSVNQRNKDSYINAELALSQIDKVRKDYAVLINRLTNLLVNYDKNLLPNQKLTVIEMLMDAYKVTGNKKALSIYSNLWIKLNKEFYLSYVETYKKMMAQQTINTLNQVTQKMELEKQLKDQELIALKNETDKKRFKLFLLTMGLVMIIGVVLFLFWRFRMLQTKKNIIKEAELTLAIKEQEFIGKDLNNVVTNLSYKRKFIDEIQDKLKGLKE
ncbi:MAG: tetratricopeptide repeat protein, partial [Vicingaceae bacterium]|nr:tetratricopeptide repeat protein [Vicingaceae bacterium]